MRSHDVRRQGHCAKKQISIGSRQFKHQGYASTACTKNALVSVHKYACHPAVKTRSSQSCQREILARRIELQIRRDGAEAFASVFVEVSKRIASRDQLELKLPTASGEIHDQHRIGEEQAIEPLLLAGNDGKAINYAEVFNGERRQGLRPEASRKEAKASAIF